MRREIAVWKVVAGLFALLLVSSGGAAALEAGPVTQAPPDERGNLAPNRSTTYVPITPCRIVSTTATGDDFAIGETRTYKAVGNLVGQGGQANCGIPASASGIEASITATFVEGPGYLRAFPSNVPEPQATFVNYTAAGASTSTGALTIAAGGTNAFKIKNYRSETHVIVDVQGYYIRPIFALVNPDGTTQLRSRINSVTRTGVGLYTVNAEIDSDLCVREVTVGRSRTSDSGSSGFGSAHITTTPANQIQVITYDISGALADRAFMIEITC